MKPSLDSFDPHCRLCHRRRFLLNAMAGSAAFFTTKGAFAEALTLTPRQTEGPFYPDHLPLDTDNDLIIINDATTPAVGEITHLHGTVRDVKGNPVPNAVVEIWQVDNNAKYIHSRDGGLDGPDRDTNFQGFGRFLTNRKGEYYFRTIKPVPYPGRTPHIHMAIYQGSGRLLTTQCYVKGEAQNERDGVLRRSIGNAPEALDLLAAEFKPLPNSKTGELVARHDLVVGLTPEDPEERRPGGRRPNGPPPGDR